MADFNDRLESWKEIAAYLGRDLRTVMRWEKERSLPVHRVPGGGRAVVYAYRSEIDAWMNGSRGALAADSGFNASFSFDWVRMRAPSPHGLMPAAIFGQLQ
jgi:excisionase family DNA binding protein